MYKNSSAENTVTLPKIKGFYEIRSRLDLNMSADYPQIIHNTVDSTENDTIISVDRIILNPGDPSEVVIESKGKKEVYVQSSEPIYRVGGEESLNIDKNSFYQYTLIKEDNGDIAKYQRTFVIGAGGGKAVYDFFCDQRENELGAGTYLIPVHISGSEVPITLTANKRGTETIIKLKDYNTKGESSNSLTLVGTQSYYVSLDNKNADDVTLTFTWATGTKKENESVIIGDITVFDGQNKNLKPDNILDKVLLRMREIIGGSDKPSTKYYYPYRSDNSIIMDNTDFEDINAMWDVNNIINKMILPQIDIVNSNIKVISSMKRD